MMLSFIDAGGGEGGGELVFSLCSSLVSGVASSFMETSIPFSLGSDAFTVVAGGDVSS